MIFRTGFRYKTHFLFFQLVLSPKTPVLRRLGDCFSFLWRSSVWQYCLYCIHLFSSCSFIYMLWQTCAHTHIHSGFFFHLSAISFCLWPIYHPRALFYIHFYTAYPFVVWTGNAQAGKEKKATRRNTAAFSFNFSPFR